MKKLQIFYISFLVGCEDTESRYIPKKLHCVDFSFKEYRLHNNMYLSKDYPEKKQIRDYYTNSKGRAGRSQSHAYTDGTQLILEVYNAEVDENGSLINVNGRLVKGNLNVVSIMEKDLSCKNKIPKKLMSGDWTYAVFSVDGSDITTLKEIDFCVSCHTEKGNKSDYVISSSYLDAFFGN